MILKTNVSPALPIAEKEVSCTVFQNSNHLKTFIKNINLYLKGRSKTEDRFLYLMNDDYQEIKKKDFYPILMDCGKLDLNLEKPFKDGTLSYFEKLVYENIEINQYFHQLQVAIDNLVNHLELSRNGYTLEVQSSTFDVKNLIKMLEIDLHHNGREINHLYLRECFTDILRHMNVDKKQEIQFILFPEVNLGLKDIPKFMKWLTKRKMTSIVVTNSLAVIENMKLSNVNLIQENKQLYDIVSLANELEIFDMRDENNWERQAIQLGYFDFMGNDILVNNEYKSFLS